MMANRNKDNLMNILNDYKNLVIEWQEYYFKTNKGNADSKPDVKKPEHIHKFIERKSNEFVIIERAKIREPINVDNDRNIYKVKGNG